jgi:alpha-1,3-glucosyltransferase
MEITLHTPVREWYSETDNNPLAYWGLDYPPLSAYQSWVTGHFMQHLEPASIALVASRGYETPSSKRLMRASVLAWDALGVPSIGGLILCGGLHPLLTHVLPETFLVEAS